MRTFIYIAFIILIAYRPAFTGSDDHLGYTATFLSLVNDHRENIGLERLEHELALDDIVGVHSEEMADGKVMFGHAGFKDRCAGARDILDGANWCGENVARGQKSPKKVFAAWMNSPGHRKNIESPKATHTGFAYAEEENGSIYWVQIFLQKPKD